MNCNYSLLAFGELCVYLFQDLNLLQKS